MVEALGPKLAAGRDSEIFEHGPGRVLRRSRDGRSLVGEAEVMSHARGLGYPVPEVFEAGSGYLVMERLVGPTMMDWMGSPPFPSDEAAGSWRTCTTGSTGSLHRPASRTRRCRATVFSTSTCIR